MNRLAVATLVATLAAYALQAGVSAAESSLDDADEPAAAAVPPGCRSDGAGGLLRYGGREWTIVTGVFSSVWDPAAKRWNRGGPVSDNNLLAVRSAVEQFNRIPGLGLKLRYRETADPAFAIANLKDHLEEFVVFWADDAATKEGLPRPFAWSPKGHKGGTSFRYRGPDGRVSARMSGKGPFMLVGAAIFARERMIKPGVSRCDREIPYYAFLHEIGHGLGLSHTSPAPSVMRGTCANTYLPIDVANFQRLYGRR